MRTVYLLATNTDAGGIQINNKQSVGIHSPIKDNWQLHNSPTRLTSKLSPSIWTLRAITCRRSRTALLIHTPHSMNHAKTITSERIWVYISRILIIRALIWWLYKLHTTSLPRVEQTFSRPITGTVLIWHVSVMCSGRIVYIYFDKARNKQARSETEAG